MMARIENDWIRCGKCGHKLGRVVMEGVTQISARPAVIEIKCSSCKELNVLPLMLKERDD